MCRTCYRRWADHGYPPSGPPVTNPGGKGVPHARQAVKGRMEDAGFLRPLCGSDTDVARRMGVTRRTLQRYTASRQQEESGTAAKPRAVA